MDVNDRGPRLVRKEREKDITEDDEASPHTKKRRNRKREEISTADNAPSDDVNAAGLTQSEGINTAPDTGIHYEWRGRWESCHCWLTGLISTVRPGPPVVHTFASRRLHRIIS